MFVGGMAGTSAMRPVWLSPRHWRALKPATHFTFGTSPCASVSEFPFVRHLGHRGGRATAIDSGATFAQQQFSVDAPHGVTHPQAFTV
jgi:hypothetical protein